MTQIYHVSWRRWLDWNRLCPCDPFSPTPLPIALCCLDGGLSRDHCEPLAASSSLPRTACDALRPIHVIFLAFRIPSAARIPIEATIAIMSFTQFYQLAKWQNLPWIRRVSAYRLRPNLVTFSKSISSNLQFRMYVHFRDRCVRAHRFSNGLDRYRCSIRTDKIELTKIKTLAEVFTAIIFGSTCLIANNRSRSISRRLISSNFVRTWWFTYSNSWAILPDWKWVCICNFNVLNVELIEISLDLREHQFPWRCPIFVENLDHFPTHSPLPSNTFHILNYSANEWKTKCPVIKSVSSYFDVATHHKFCHG